MKRLVLALAMLLAIFVASYEYATLAQSNVSGGTPAGVPTVSATNAWSATQTNSSPWLGGFVLGNQGSAFANGSAVPGAGWGTTAATSAASGTAQRFIFTITSNGTGQAANPTTAITFPATWPVTPFFICKQVGGTGAISAITGENGTSTTTMTIIWNGTPVAASTYIILCEGE